MINANVAELTGIPDFGPLTVAIPERSSDLVPPVDPDYHFGKSSVLDFLLWYSDLAADLADAEAGHAPLLDTNRKGLWLSGPKGTGKTSFVEQICARFNLPVVQVPARTDMCWEELVVTKDLVGGDTIDVDGALTRAMRAGAIILINEAGFLKSTETGALHDLVLRNQITLPGSGEVVVAKPGFGIIATSNSNGSGDQSGQYGGERRQNGAWMDRFCVTEMEYLPREIEEKILAAKVPSLGDETRSLLIDIAAMSRAAHANPEGREAKELEESGGGVPDSVIDTRSLISWAQKTDALLSLAQMGVNLSTDPHFALKHALNFTVANKGDPGTRVAFRKLLDLKLAA